MTKKTKIKLCMVSALSVLSIPLVGTLSIVNNSFTNEVKNVTSNQKTSNNVIDLNLSRVNNFNYGNIFANNFDKNIVLGHILPQGQNMSNYIVGLDLNGNYINSKINASSNISYNRILYRNANATQLQDQTGVYEVDSDFYEWFQSSEQPLLFDKNSASFVNMYNNSGVITNYETTTGASLVGDWKQGFSYWVKNGNTYNNISEWFENPNNNVDISFFEYNSQDFQINQNSPYATVGLKFYESDANNRSAEIRIGKKGFRWIDRDGQNSSELSASEGLTWDVNSQSSYGYGSVGIFTYALDSSTSDIDVYSGNTNINNTNISSSFNYNNYLDYSPSYFINDFASDIERSISITMDTGFPGCREGDSTLKLIANDEAGTVDVEFKPGSILKNGGVYDNNQTKRITLFSGFRSITTRVVKNNVISNHNLTKYSVDEIVSVLGKSDYASSVKSKEEQIYMDVLQTIYNNRNTLFENFYDPNPSEDLRQKISLANGYYELVSSDSTSITFKFTLKNFYKNGTPISNWNANPKGWTLTINNLVSGNVVPIPLIVSLSVIFGLIIILCIAYIIYKNQKKNKMIKELRNIDSYKL